MVQKGGTDKRLARSIERDWCMKNLRIFGIFMLTFLYGWKFFCYTNSMYACACFYVNIRLLDQIQRGWNWDMSRCDTRSFSTSHLWWFAMYAVTECEVRMPGRCNIWCLSTGYSTEFCWFGDLVSSHTNVTTRRKTSSCSNMSQVNIIRILHQHVFVCPSVKPSLLRSGNATCFCLPVCQAVTSSLR
jgi:hypothetical protein